MKRPVGMLAIALAVLMASAADAVLRIVAASQTESFGTRRR